MSIKPVQPVENPVRSEPEPFSEPKTFPKGWDLSGLMEAYNPPSMPVGDEPEAFPLPVKIECDFSADVAG